MLILTDSIIGYNYNENSFDACLMWHDLVDFQLIKHLGLAIKVELSFQYFVKGSLPHTHTHTRAHTHTHTRTHKIQVLVTLLVKNVSI